MWHDNVGSFGPGMAGPMFVLVIVALAALGALSWLILDVARAHPHLSHHAEVILAQRYARGEIDAKEYWRRLDDIRGRGR